MKILWGVIVSRVTFAVLMLATFVAGIYGGKRLVTAYETSVDNQDRFNRAQVILKLKELEGNVRCTEE